MELEEKIRRRLAPFVVEGKIAAPRIEAGPEATLPLTVSVQLKRAGVEAALHEAISDVSDGARLVIEPA